MKKTYTIGVDIGGTKMLAILFDGKNIIADYELATPKDTYEHFMIMLNALIEPLFDKAQQDKVSVELIGIGIAGVIDKKDRKILNSPNIEIINNRKIAADLEKQLETKILIDNDANCFLRAETTIGVAKKYKNAYGFIIGTGIGGAWWLNNEIYDGCSGGAGEPGAMILDCSKHITIEDAYKNLIQNIALKLSEESYAGDPLAQKLFDELASILAIMVSNVINLLDPEVIVLAGGTVNASDLFLSKMKKKTREYILSPEGKKIKILKTKLEKYAGAIGAALLN